MSFATIGSNTLLGNATSSTGYPTATSIPSCSGASNALTWTLGTGFGCNTISGGSSITGSQYQVVTMTGTNTAAGNANIVTDSSNDLSLINPTAATSGSTQVASPSLILQGNYWTGSATATGKDTITYTPSYQNGYAAGILTNTFSDNSGSVYHISRFSGTNSLVSAVNTNDNLGSIFGETYNTAFFGLENNTGSYSGVIPSGYQWFFFVWFLSHCLSFPFLFSFFFI